MSQLSDEDDEDDGDGNKLIKILLAAVMLVKGWMLLNWVRASLAVMASVLRMAGVVGSSRPVLESITDDMCEMRMRGWEEYRDQERCQVTGEEEASTRDSSVSLLVPGSEKKSSFSILHIINIQIL